MKLAIFLVVMILAGVAAFLFLDKSTSEILVSQVAEVFEEKLPPLPEITEMRAIYVTASTARSARMDDLIQLIKKTNLNSVVIDVKDENGEQLNEPIKVLVKRLRFLKIFPIARLSVFQDNGLAKKYPDLAVKSEDGLLWRDRGGRYWLNPENKEGWNYILKFAQEVAAAGFGEINFDYIRYPTDGYKGDVKKDVILEFSRFVKDSLKKDYPEVKLTADVFGYALLRSYDLGIGQSAPEMAQIFDEVCPMIYPSHYDSGNFNFENPADHPYEVVYETLKKGKEIFEQQGVPFTNIRPWIQDFNLGAIYTPEMVRAQIRAIDDFWSGVGGLPGATTLPATLNFEENKVVAPGWMVWNPNNKYREAIFEISN